MAAVSLESMPMGTLGCVGLRLGPSALAGVVVCLGLLAGRAHAHGGAPYPTPVGPEPVMPGGQPPGGAPGTPLPRAPLPVTTGGGGPTSRPRLMEDSARSEVAWQTWWRTQRWPFLPARDGRGPGAPVTGGDAPRANPGEGGAPLDPHVILREQLAERAVLPLLLEIAASGTASDDMRASALLALARISTAPEALRLVTSLARDAQAPWRVREAAALALGLFRRTEARLQLEVGALERLREAALDVVDEEDAADRTRCFAAFALGLLADQPYPDGAAQGGAAWAQLLWARLLPARASDEIPVALLTALGCLPSGHMPLHVRDGLRGMIVGRAVQGRVWSDRVRSHALTALARLHPQLAVSDLLRVLARAHEADDVVRAASIAVSARSPAWSDDQRAALLPVLLRAEERANDPWTEGLLRMSLGALVAADVEHGAGALGSGPAPRRLFEACERAPDSERGYALVALALAARAVPSGGAPLDWAPRARRLFLDGLTRESEDDGLRASHAVALGLLGGEGAIPLLSRVVGDRSVGVQTRGHAAVALAQLDARGDEAVRAICVALGERGKDELRAQAALALSWMRSQLALTLLLHEVGQPRASENVLAQAAVALGRLGDLGAVGPLARLARDERRGDTGRALAIVALGLVLDPEPRPSLTRLTVHANYPARSAALSELLSIL